MAAIREIRVTDVSTADDTVDLPVLQPLDDPIAGVDVGARTSGKRRAEPLTRKELRQRRKTAPAGPARRHAAGNRRTRAIAACVVGAGGGLAIFEAGHEVLTRLATRGA